MKSKNGIIKRMLPQKTQFIAVDLGARQTKLVQLNTACDPPGALRMAIYKTPGDVFGPAGIQDEKAVEFLAGLVETEGIRGKEIITCIPGDRVITRYARVPKAGDKELSRIIQVEAGKSIPIPIADLSLRHVRIDGGEDGQSETVMIVAVPAELVMKYYDLFSGAGVKVVAVDHTPLALWRVFFGMADQGPGTVAAFDIGATHTNMVVARDNRLAFSRILPVGGDAITRSVAEANGIEFAEAQQYKEEKGKILTADEAAATFNPEDMQMDYSLRDGLSQLTSEIRRSLEYYISQPGAAPVDRLLFSGGSSKLQGFMVFIADALEMSAQLVQIPLSYYDDEGRDTPVDPSYSVAVGLALRGRRCFR